MSDLLKLDKRLPMIKLPKEKVKSFIEWFNKDLTNLYEFPEIFEEGYLNIDLTSTIIFKGFTIFDEVPPEIRARTSQLNDGLTKTYTDFIVYFKAHNNTKMNIKIYCGTNEIIFDGEFDLKDDKIQTTLKQLADKNYKVPEVPNRISMDIRVSNQEEFKSRLEIFSQEISMLSRILLVTTLWYLAINKKEKYEVPKYKVEERSISAKYIDSKTHTTKDRVIKISNPTYNLIDKRATDVVKLIKKREGWSITYSFQVRGHYRHYKNGKTIFIKSYTKGKDLEKANAPTYVIDK